MKKTILNILLLAGVCIAPANNVSAQNAGTELKSNADTLAYALGMAQADGLKMALSQADFKNTEASAAEFKRGFTQAAKLAAATDAEKAYLRGIMFGQVVAERMLPGINKELFADDSGKSINVDLILAGMFDGMDGKSSIMAADKAQGVVEAKIPVVKKEQYQSIIDEGDAFIANYAKQKKVKKLPCGVLYKEIKTNKKGAVPVDTCKVKVHYEGKLTDGKVFDSSYNRGEPTVFGVTQVIKGWTETLKVMPVGSKWEVVIPYELAYGERGAGQDIKPYSTLVFTIELLDIVESEDEKPAE